MLDYSMIALYGAGRPMWLWVNVEQSKEAIERIIVELCNCLKENKLYGVSGEPTIANSFTQVYSMGMESYHCPKVMHPQNVPGKMIPSQTCHTGIIAECCAGFNSDGFGNKVTIESQIPSAERLINSGNLYLWTVNDIVVSMANIAHRSPRQARINSV